MFCPKCREPLKKFQAAMECEHCKNRWFILNTFEPRVAPQERGEKALQLRKETLLKELAEIESKLGQKEE